MMRPVIGISHGGGQVHMYLDRATAAELAVFLHAGRNLGERLSVLRDEMDFRLTAQAQPPYVSNARPAMPGQEESEK